MSTLRVGDRDVRVSKALLDRLKKTPPRQMKSVKERIMKWAEGAAGVQSRPPHKRKGHPPPTRPLAPKGGKGQKPSRVADTFNTRGIPAHVLFRKRTPVARH
jgi:hypothetical protein